MDLNVVRVKRKATEEPAEALVIALKKPKCEDKKEELFLKLAATLTHEEDVKAAGARAALIKDRIQRIQQRHSLRHQHSYSSSLSQRAKALKQERVERRQNLLAGRRLILSESYSNGQSEENLSEQEENLPDHGRFKLYDIIEEKEETKLAAHSKSDENSSSMAKITCNGVPLIRVTGPPIADSGDYVYDYYIATGELDQKFIDNSVSVESCEPEELVHPGEYDDPEEYYDDEDDSNEEDNWRNDYPDEDSDFEKNRDYYDDYEDSEEYIMTDTLRRFNIDEDRDGSAYASYKARVMRDLEDDESDDANEYAGV